MLPAERFLGAIRAGIRYAHGSPEVRAVLVRGACFTIFASALWALLPLVVREELGRGPDAYGLLLAALGAGAVGCAILLPRLRDRLGAHGLVSAGTVVFALAILALGTLRSFWLLAAVLVLGGAAWLGSLSTLNVAVQQSVPGWVLARALSVYLLSFFGSLSLGSAMWGVVAGRLGVPATLVLASGGMLLGLAAAARYRIPSEVPRDLTPSLHWPDPVVAHEPAPDRGPVLVTVEYRIDPERSAEFATAMRDMRRIRLRDGAMRWHLFADAADPGRWVETYLSPSWVEHLRQHERVTHADEAIEARARAFHLGEKPPAVSHLIAEGPRR
jgi:MFS family permease